MSRKSESVKDNFVLLSIHDVSPMFEDDVLSVYDRLTDLGIISFTLLVTPMHSMRKTNILEQHPIFSEYLTSLNLEVSLHGYSHSTKSGQADEFARITKGRAETRLRSGIGMIRGTLGQNPYGFVPPMWRAPPRVANVAKSLGLHYCVNENDIHRFSDSTILKTADFIVSQGDRSVSFENAMLEMELGGPLQIAIHPRDHEQNHLFSLLEDMKDRLGYKFSGYRDYILFSK
jgi:predicted deacetylase